MLAVVSSWWARFPLCWFKWRIRGLSGRCYVIEHEKSNELSKSSCGESKSCFSLLFFNHRIKWNAHIEMTFILLLQMVALLPLQALAYFGLLTLFKLKARSAFLASMSLTNFSEFGLIVAAVAAPESDNTGGISCGSLVCGVSFPLNHVFLISCLVGMKIRLAYRERHPNTRTMNLFSWEC